MSNTDEVDNNLINLCSGILDEIEEDIDARERELQMLFEQLSSQDAKYSDKEFIAEGGMKIISRVKDSASLRSVAIAELRKQDLKPDKILNFYNEARVTALLEHPNIVPIYEIGHHDGTPYFTMKEIQGETLGSILKKLKDGNEEYIAKYPLSSLLNILLKVCDAISYSHSRKIVHLDLKPDNIHVGEFGEVLVIDWGLAKNLDKHELIESYAQIQSEIDTEKTLDGFVKGTIGYMAPEQARGENDNKDVRTDIYALGSILYSILTKSSPYSDQDINQALMLIARGKYTPIDESKYPSALCAVFHKALEPKQADRYQKVSEFSTEIHRFQQGFATDAQEAGFKDLVTLFIKRNFVVSSLVFCFTIIFLIGTYTSIDNIQQEKKIASENARQAIENAKLAIVSEKKAKKSEQEARENEKRAIELFTNLKESNEEKRKLENLSYPLTIRRYYGYLHERNLEKLMETIDSVYREDIDDAEYWFLRAKALIGQLNFSKALVDLKRARDCSNEAPNHWKINKFIELLTQNNKVKDLDPEEVIRLCRETQRISSEVVDHMFFTGASMIANKDKKADFLKRALIMVNPEVKKLNFSYSYSPKGYDIDLSNNQHLTNLSPLMLFPLYKLNLENCKKIDSFNPLKRSNVQILNLSGIDSTYYQQHITFKKLTHLYMRNCAFKYQWFIASTIIYFDLSGSTVDFKSCRIRHIPNLNLCQSHILNFYVIKNISGLARIVIPQNYKVHDSMLKRKERKGSKIVFCNCQKKDCYKSFSKDISKIK
ncbi:MAG: protein kinase [Lentisphaeraceae bacterium]|nr:protein kinase [Lentisphaeraceae bacterium]